jgi:hypothetical protein
MRLGQERQACLKDWNAQKAAGVGFIKKHIERSTRYLFTERVLAPGQITVDRMDLGPEVRIIARKTTSQSDP